MLARIFSSETLNYRVLREKDGGPRVLYSHQSLFRFKTTDRISQFIIHLSQFSLLCQNTDWGAYQQRNYLLTVLEAGSPRSSAAQWVLGRGPLPRSYWLSSHFVLTHRERERALAGVPFMRTRMPFSRAPPSSPPKGPRPHTITLRVGFQRMNLGGTQAFSHFIIHVLAPGE